MASIVSLYVAYGANFVLPLVTIPYLTRTLGVQAWGTMAAVQSFGVWAGLVIEYGFGLSATRDVCMHRHDDKICAHILGGVLGAQAFLTGVIVGVTFLLSRMLTSTVLAQPKFLVLALSLAIGQGFNPGWFFRGLERMQASALIDMAPKIAAAVLLFVFVKSPDDVSNALLLNVFAAWATVIAGAFLVRRTPPRMPNGKVIRQLLRDGATLFLTRSGVSLYTSANGFLLSLFASPAVVGLYAGAEKLSRATVGVLSPMSTALFVRQNYLASRPTKEFRQLLVLSAVTTLPIALVICGLLNITASKLVLTFLGRNFGQSTPLLHILSLLVVLVQITNILGVQWLIPRHKDKQFGLAVLLGAVVNVFAAIALAPHFGAKGMAISVVLAQSVVASVCGWLALRETRANSRRQYTTESGATAMLDH